MQEDLNVVITRYSLERFRPLFDEQEMDLDSFLTLTADDLQELGMYALFISKKKKIG